MSIVPNSDNEAKSVKSIHEYWKQWLGRHNIYECKQKDTIFEEIKLTNKFSY